MFSVLSGKLRLHSLLAPLPHPPAPPPLTRRHTLTFPLAHLALVIYLVRLFVI